MCFTATLVWLSDELILNWKLDLLVDHNAKNKSVKKVNLVCCHSIHLCVSQTVELVKMLVYIEPVYFQVKFGQSGILTSWILKVIFLWLRRPVKCCQFKKNEAFEII